MFLSSYNGNDQKSEPNHPEQAQAVQEGHAGYDFRCLLQVMKKPGRQILRPWTLEPDHWA